MSSLLQNRHLQVSPDVNITAGDFRCAKEDMTAIATGTSDLDRLCAAMRGRSVNTDWAALIAVGRIDGPCSLVPSTFEPFGDLSNGERQDSKGEGEKGALAEHFRGWIAGCRKIWR